MANDSRARLIAYLCQAGLSTARANAVLDDFTHQLAEEIRLAAEARVGWGQPMREAADVIDPEAA